ncbi:MAG TPA: PAS domain S-box protein, partial [Thermoanaerobaculia bacterium]|nr:PAS domain S-box protein [Thermoanaerobaculia bacterium]
MYKDVVELVESNPRDRIESLAQAVLDALPAHVALLDARGTIVTVNRAWREWGAQRGAVPERTAEGVSYLAVCRTSASAEAMAVAIEAVLRGETPIAVAEYECHHGNDRRWFVCEVARVEGWEGALVAHTEVTESVLAFREAEKVRQRYRALFERNLAGVVRCTAGGVILECNAAFAALLGVASPEALPGRLVTELFDSREWDQFAAAAGEETSVSFETAVRRPDGRMVWLIVTAVASDDAAQPFLEAMAVDITDTKRREDAYQREAEVESAISAIYSDLLQAAPEEIDVAIERGLHRAGMLSGGERAHLLAIEKRRATSLFEWRRPGIAVRFRAGEPFRLPESRWLVEQLAAGRGVMASRIPDLPDAHTRALLEAEGVGALIVVPMMGMDGLAGALAIESSHEYAWPDEMVLILHLLAETFARVIERRRAEESLRTANRMLETRVNERTAELRAL